MSRRILVMRGGALGDFILGLPALRALREAFPGARLELIAPRVVLPLAVPLVDSALPVELAENALLFGDAPLPPDLAERYSGLDLVVLWLADPDGTVRRNFESCGSGRLLQAPALPPRDAHVHATDYLLSTLEPLGIPHRSAGVSPVPGPPIRDEGTGRRPALLKAAISRDSVKHANTLLHRFGLTPSDQILAIHAGSGGQWKCWPPERFAEVAHTLPSSGLKPLLIQGPADDEAVARMIAALEDDSFPIVSGLPVLDLAALLSLCAVYLGNDSGVTHLAAAVGVSTVALFGPSDPAIWGPRGKTVTILHGKEGRLEEIAVESVIRAVLTAAS